MASPMLQVRSLVIVIAGEAKQSSFYTVELDCFVASLLAMTRSKVRVS
jgi:hypothetical protein